MVLGIHVLFAWYFPLIGDVIGYDMFYNLRSVIQLCVTVICMGFLFDLPFGARLSSCVAGYAMQHITYNIVTLINHTGLLCGMGETALQRHLFLETFLFPLVYLLFFLTLGRYTAKKQGYKYHDYRFILLSFVTVFVCTGIRRVAVYMGELDTVTACLYSITCCSLALGVQQVLFRTVVLKHENDTINLLWQEERKHYAISKQNMDLINVKCHDLKYILAALNERCSAEEIRTLEHALQIYDSNIKTGHEALDVLLAENSLRCGREGITINYSGNGAELDFMTVTDVYSLFGNAVDNAVDAVRKLSEQEKRIINITLEAKGDAVIVNISNYFCGDAVFEDGVPVTTKPDAQMHGFGVKSMGMIAEKYGGSLKASVDGDIFRLSIYLMKT